MKVKVQCKNEPHEFEADSSKALLFSGLEQGLSLPYACASGTCGGCRATLKSGSVIDLWPAAPGKSNGNDILLCQCVPSTDCELELKSSVSRDSARASALSPVSARIATWQLLTNDVATLKLELARPVAYQAGQFVLLGLPGIEGRRAYSMVNYEPGSRDMELLIKRKPGGNLTAALFSTNPSGRQVHVVGPLGAAVFDPTSERDLLCIAGGSGVAGMVAILEHALAADYFDKRSGHLFFGVRSPEDLFFLDRFSSMSKGSGGALRIVVCLSHSQVPADMAARFPYLTFAEGMVHEVALKQMAGQLSNVHAFLAGPPPAVDAAMRGLIIQGKLSPRNISFDKFS